MQPQLSSRINLVQLKAQIVKRIGAEKSKQYFYYLNRFLSQKLSKTEFDRSCYRVLGRENLPLHNHFIKSILKNACQAKTPPPVQQVTDPHSKSGTLVNHASPGREDGHEQSVANFQNQNASIWSNGVLPISPRKLRSGVRDRRLKDRPSPLGPNGKVDSVAHQSTATEDSGSKVDMENGILTPCDYQRPTQHLQAVDELPENGIGDAIRRPSQKPRIHGKGPRDVSIVEDGEEVEQLNRLNFSRSPLVAPLGIPYGITSVSVARKTLPVNSTSNVASCCDSGRLSDTDSLRRRMEQIATVQGLGSVSVECANTLNSMLDVYLKRMIRSCVDLGGGRSANEQSKLPVSKQQIQGKVINGFWPNNHLQVQSASGLVEPELGCRPPHPVSLHDFKVAMELNPQLLGKDWPVQLEKISMQSFEE
ncbi:unnamed protein product [Sphenostylis stenocarpa]|uniref:Transcriptional coactivator Hfi1/Transcriptional adapter 1 n=1 Tax=Sphenostylis stenocarpa TaxID=92480 RepID=A0AA86T0R1_9FABA|nr:unnamed protein product [Sphenostylis stenocarpa]